MIPVVCICALLFGNWPLKWDAKSRRFRFSYYFVFTSAFMLCTIAYFVSGLITIMVYQSLSTNPQYLIMYTIHINNVVLLANRWLNAKLDERFANELMADADGRTVESGRHLPEFWCRVVATIMFIIGMYCKYAWLNGNCYDPVTLFKAVLPLVTSMCVGATAECVYTSACAALADAFAAANRRAETVTGTTAVRDIRRLTGAHCRLVRLVRSFDAQYGAAMFLTTFNLLLGQTYLLNSTVSALVDDRRFPYAADAAFMHAFDLGVWGWFWWRLWWICHRVQCLVGQVQLTAKIMFEKDLNSYPEDTRQLALDFLDQLLHRHVRMTAWGFYEINKELLFTVLGYQIGVCLICTQFSTSGTLMFDDEVVGKN